MQRNWNQLGESDPLWAILADPDKKGGKWDVAEFFSSGEEEINRVMDQVGSLHQSLARGRALDFGCGVGRVTQALCRYFNHCDGVDIASSMIRLAEEWNRFGNRCHYHVSVSNALPQFSDNSFDFVYSRLVLQHIEAKHSKKYIKELLRVLAPGGVLVFQVPSGLSYEALPRSGFRAHVSVPRPPETAQPGSQMTLQVTVRNISGVTWPAADQIKLGNHWLADKRIVVRDDGRVSLPKDLPPTHDVVLPLVVQVPAEPGSYILELDMVQEMVTWFKDRGSKTTKLRIEVGDARPGEGHARSLGDWFRGSWGAIKTCCRSIVDLLGVKTADAHPGIEMYYIPKSEVLHLIGRCGGQVLDVQEDDAAGPGWLDFCYYITKPHS